ncbi:MULTISPECIES: hypothetical protein [Crateriforma]|uniref:Uncharacterized protein n=1 Tax=Crateriforma conspicua TaxID=2527996 RepID=A0A5C6FRE8_9PLAN|nr:MULTISPECIES: hypothetical protein [Crateriforma]TWU63066.1 hypothetical protein V7x_48040 [Crateriforma conspicua]
MKHRILSRVSTVASGRHCPALLPRTLLTAGILCGVASNATAQQASSGLYTDPTTGIGYAPVKKTIERPVQETRMVSRQQTTYAPRTVTETRPTTRTTLYPVTRTVLEPYYANRWNPFAKPSLAYRFKPQVHWQTQTDVVNQTTTRTEYVAETKTVQVPETVHRIVREERVDYEPVGQVTRQAASTATSDLAARLRPLGSGERIVPFGSSSANLARSTNAPRLSSTTVAGTTPVGSTADNRSISQAGQPATTLAPRTSGYGLAAPPAAGVGIATMPAATLMR